MSNTRWTVVTGASCGIGVELARTFAAIGHNLVLVARRRERLDQLAGELKAGHRAEVQVMPLDLAKPESAGALLDGIDAKGLAVHTLVNNAGFGLRGQFAELPLDEQVAMVNLNVTGPTQLSRLVLPRLIERGRGGILNVASMAAFQAGPNMAVYYATKAYLLSLSEALHEEAKPHGVTVTALCPGPTQSEFADRAGMKEAGLFRRFAMSPAKVAQAGVDGYRAGHAVVVPGAANRVGSLAAGLLPRFLTRRAAGRLQA